MHQYKNISGVDQSIIGVGLVPADAEFSTNVKIQNPNFQPISGAPESTQPAPVATESAKEAE